MFSIFYFIKKFFILTIDEILIPITMLPLKIYNINTKIITII